jgi:hypothetical protein
MDIVMPLKDYRKFAEIAAVELKSEPGFELFDGLRAENSYINFLKLHNKNTTFISDIAMPYPHNYTGVFLDIFPLFGLPSCPSERRRMQSSIMHYTYRIGRHKALGEYPGDDLAMFVDRLESLRAMISFDDSSHSAAGYQVFETADLLAAEQVKFEDATIYQPRNAKEQILAQYPGFEKYPKDMTSRSGHLGLIDLETPYQKYAEQYGKAPALLDYFLQQNIKERRLKDELIALREKN